MIQNNARHGCISGTKRTTQYCQSAVEKLNDAAPQFSKSNACFWQRHRPYPSCGAAIRLCPRSSCLDDKPFNAVADKQALAQLDRKSVGSGKRVSVRVDFGGVRNLKNKKTHTK